MHERTPAEVDELIGGGAQVLMLPMFSGPEEVSRFLEVVGGRATVVPLLETRSAAERVTEIVALDGVRELHVGINGLALSIGVGRRFEVLLSPLLERVAAAARDAGLRLGIGAIGRIGDDGVPVPPDLLYARYVALGARAALVARTFLRDLHDENELAREIAISRRRLSWWRAADEEQRARADRALRSAIGRAASW